MRLCDSFLLGFLAICYTYCFSLRFKIRDHVLLGMRIISSCCNCNSISTIPSSVNCEPLVVLLWPIMPTREYPLGKGGHFEAGLPQFYHASLCVMNTYQVPMLFD